jgi:hypothetical protein
MRARAGSNLCKILSTDEDVRLANFGRGYQTYSFSYENRASLWLKSSFENPRILFGNLCTSSLLTVFSCLLFAGIPGVQDGSMGEMEPAAWPAPVHHHSRKKCNHESPNLLNMPTLVVSIMLLKYKEKPS